MQRLKKRHFKDGKIEWTNSQLILCKFFDGSLPTTISLFEGEYGLKVKPFIKNVRRCYKCLKIGHIKKHCQSPNSACFTCGQDVRGECYEPPNCVNCEGEHKSLDKSCEMFQIETKVNKEMAYSNLSYIEAKRKVLGEVKTGGNNINREKHNKLYIFREEEMLPIYKPRSWDHKPTKDTWENVHRSRPRENRWDDKIETRKMRENLSYPTNNRYASLADTEETRYSPEPRQGKFIRPPRANKYHDENMDINRKESTSRETIYRRDHKKKEELHDLERLIERVFEIAKNLNLEREVSDKISHHNAFLRENRNKSNRKWMRRPDHQQQENNNFALNHWEDRKKSQARQDHYYSKDREEET